MIFRKISNSDKRLATRMGIQLVSFPALEFRSLNKKLPDQSFDYLVLTSAQTCRFLGKLPNVKNIVVIGQETKKSLLKILHRVKLKKPKIIVLDESNSLGIEKFFKKKKSQMSILFPRSALGDTALPKKLRKMGFRISVRLIYKPQFLNLKSASRYLRSDVSFCITSPSILLALKKTFGLPVLRRSKIHWIAIGPTTWAALKKAGFHAKLAKKPSLQALLAEVS